MTCVHHLCHILHIQIKNISARANGIWLGSSHPMRQLLHESYEMWKYWCQLHGHSHACLYTALQLFLLWLQGCSAQLGSWRVPNRTSLIVTSQWMLVPGCPATGQRQTCDGIGRSLLIACSGDIATERMKLSVSSSHMYDIALVLQTLVWPMGQIPCTTQGLLP